MQPLTGKCRKTRLEGQNWTLNRAESTMIWTFWLRTLEKITSGDLTSPLAVLKYRQFPANSLLNDWNRETQHPESMTPTPPSPLPEKRSNAPCKHPRVQIVAREEDSEFVECLECREIFESSEFKDMAIEETKPPEEDGI